MMKRKHIIAGGIGALVLLALTAGASAYIATEMKEDKPAATKAVQSEKITWNNDPPPPPPQKAETCDDANIIGAVIGAGAGGLAGNQFGDGKGQDLATIGGAIGGGWLGKEYIPTDGALCP